MEYGISLKGAVSGAVNGHDYYDYWNVFERSGNRCMACAPFRGIDRNKKESNIILF